MHAHLLRAAAAHFPGDPRLAALLEKGGASETPSVRLLALAAARP
jgi:hypothetical protein